MPPATEPIPGVTTPSTAAARVRVSRIRLGRSWVSVRLSGPARVRVAIARKTGGRYRTVTSVRGSRRSAGTVRRSLIAHMRLRDGLYRVSARVTGPAGTPRATTVKRVRLGATRPARARSRADAR